MLAIESQTTPERVRMYLGGGSLGPWCMKLAASKQAAAGECWLGCITSATLANLVTWRYKGGYAGQQAAGEMEGVVDVGEMAVVWQ